MPSLLFATLCSKIQKEMLKPIIKSHYPKALEHFPCQTAEVSESALNKSASNQRHRGKNSHQKQPNQGCISKEGEPIKSVSFITLIYFMTETENQLRAEYSILPVWHTEWAFQRQTWEENVCSCTEPLQPQRALFHQNTGSSDRGWTMRGKKWLRWQTKIDLALLCAFSSPHPTLFSIFRAAPGWRKWRKAAAGWRRRDGKGKERGGEEGGQQGPGSSGSLKRNRRALKAIYRPRGAGGGWGWVSEQCGRHWDNQ